MSYSPAFKWLVALLLCLTVVWKFPARLGDLGGYTSRVEKFLAGRQFDVVLTQQNLDGMPLIRATKGECRLAVAKSSSYGWNRDIIRDQRTGNDRLFYVFRGRVYDDQPMWLTVLFHLWSKTLVQLGLLPHEIPVIAVIASEACATEGVPWATLDDEP